MRIALVSTVYHLTPPVGYGGIERVVSLLAEALHRAGHEVVLFGLEGSRFSGTLVEVPHLRDDRQSGVRSVDGWRCEEGLYDCMKHYLSKHPVDIVHDWSFQNHYVLRHADEIPGIISTCIPPTEHYQRPNLVGCSQAHANLLGPQTRYVHYGLDLEQWSYSFEKTSPIIHIAKMARYKAQHLAVLAARRAKVELELAGNIEDALYYNALLRPLVWLSRNVRFMGELKHTNAQLKTAKALLQTPHWFDAFPLVVLEAMAAGT